MKQKYNTLLAFTLTGGPFHNQVLTAHPQELSRGELSVFVRRDHDTKRLTITKEKNRGHEYLFRDEDALSRARLAPTRLYHIDHDVGLESKVCSLLPEFDLVTDDRVFFITQNVDKSLLNGLFNFGWFIDPKTSRLTLRTPDGSHAGIRYAYEICHLTVGEE